MLKNSLSDIQVLGLLAMSVQQLSTPIQIDPAEYFGSEGLVKEVLADPAKALRGILQKQYPSLVWPEKEKVWKPLIELFKEDCEHEHQYALFGVAERRRASCMKVIEYDKAIPGVLSRKIVDDAHEGLAAATRTLTSVREAENED